MVFIYNPAAHQLADPMGGKTSGGNKGNGGGGAPFVGGMIVSLVMIAAFGAWKWDNGKLKKKQSGQELK